jgi:hypothetical protein
MPSPTVGLSLLGVDCQRAERGRVELPRTLCRGLARIPTGCRRRLSASLSKPRAWFGPKTVRAGMSGEREGRTPKDFLRSLVRVAAGCRRLLSASLSKSVTNGKSDVGALGLRREGGSNSQGLLVSSDFESGAVACCRLVSPRAAPSDRRSRSQLPALTVCGRLANASATAGPDTSTTARPSTTTRP